MGTIQQDTGYAWVVCLGSFLAFALHCNLLYSRGIFYIIFRREFAGSSGAISLIPSLNSAFNYGFAPIAGVLVSKFGVRTIGILGGICTSAGLILASRATELYQLYLTYGALTGIGVALIFNPCVTVLPVYFDKRLSLAAGIAVSGCGVGFVVFQYFIKYLDDEYGWRGTLLILGAIQLHCIAIALVYGSVNHGVVEVEKEKTVELDKVKKSENANDNSDPNTNTEDITVKELCLGDTLNVKPSMLTSLKSNAVNELKIYVTLVKNPTYTLFSLGQLFSVVADSIVYTHLGALAISVNHTAGDAALLFTVVGVSNTFMRLLFGVIAQWVDPLLLCCIASLSLAVVTMTLFLMTSLPLLIVYAVAFGGLCAPYHTSPILVTSKVIESAMLPRAIGLQTTVLAPGSLLGPLMAGVLYDMTGTYKTSFIMASGFLVLASISAMAPLAIAKIYKGKSAGDHVNT